MFWFDPKDVAQKYRNSDRNLRNFEICRNFERNSTKMRFVGIFVGIRLGQFVPPKVPVAGERRPNSVTPPPGASFGGTGRRSPATGFCYPPGASFGSTGRRQPSPATGTATKSRYQKTGDPPWCVVWWYHQGLVPDGVRRTGRRPVPRPCSGSGRRSPVAGDRYHQMKNHQTCRTRGRA